MSKVLIIGCGGVASVAIHKCCQVPEVFTEICIASRTKSKCDKLAAELAPKTATKITTAQRAPSRRWSWTRLRPSPVCAMTFPPTAWPTPCSIST